MSLIRARRSLAAWPLWLAAVAVLLAPLAPLAAAPAPGVPRTQGAQAADATFAALPNVVAGTTSAGVIRTLRVDDDGAITTAPGSSPQQVEGVVADAGTLTGTNPVLIAGQDGSVVQSLLTDTSGRLVVVGAAASGAAVAGDPLLTGISDGTNVRTRLSVSGAGNTAGTGIAAVGPLIYDGTNWQQQRSGHADGLSVTAFAGATPMLFNGTNNDRQRSANGANNTTGTGLGGAAPMLFDGTNYQRQQGLTGATGQARVGFQNSYTHIDADATTVVKSGAGVLHTILVGSTSVGGTVTVYDNTSAAAPIIAVISTVVGEPTTIELNVAFATGLTLVTASTGTDADITVSYN